MILGVGFALSTFGSILAVLAVARAADPYLRPGIAVGLISVNLIGIGFALALQRLAIRIRLLNTQARRDYEQIEALLSLHSSLKPPYPLPPTRGWAMSPDLLRFLAAEIIENRPSRVVEFGSGVSTLVLALALDKAQHGHLISLESDARHLQQTERMLRKFGVDHHARVVLGPLTWIESDEQKLYWYDIGVLEENSRFDLIIVDGPSTSEDPLARYPALITMERRFSDSGVLVLDDAVRAGETEIARKWREKYPQLEFQYIDHEKGTLIVRRSRLAVTTSQLEQNK